MTKTNLSKEELQRRKELRDRLLEAIDNGALPDNQKSAAEKPLTHQRAKEIIDEVWSKKRFVNGCIYPSLKRERS